MNIITTLKDWCIENDKEDILKEFTGLMKDDIEFNNIKKSNPQNIKYNSNSMAIWKCQVCGRKQYLKVKERISLPILYCSCRIKECKSSIDSKNTVLRRISTKGTKNEVQNISKVLHTSMVEQFIFFYIKNIFPDSVSRKKFEWLGNSEFDIYIPSLKLAIEYDGSYYHIDKESKDKEKNKLAQKHNITLFRIREEGLRLIDATDYRYKESKDYSNIDIAINATIKFINKKYNMNIDYIGDFDFDAYKNKVLIEIKNQKNKNSIAGKWPEIDKYWNYKKNGIIKPEDIMISDKAYLWAECPFCHKNVKFRAYHTYKYGGKESFAPHNCDKRNVYCLEHLKEYYKEYHNTNIQGNSLEARRLRDWINHIKYIAAFDIKLQNKLKEFNIKI